MLKHFCFIEMQKNTNAYKHYPAEKPPWSLQFGVDKKNYFLLAWDKCISYLVRIKRVVYNPHAIQTPKTPSLC